MGILTRRLGGSIVGRIFWLSTIRRNDGIDLLYNSCCLSVEMIFSLIFLQHEDEMTFSERISMVVINLKVENEIITNRLIKIGMFFGKFYHSKACPILIPFLFEFSLISKLYLI